MGFLWFCCLLAVSASVISAQDSDDVPSISNNNVRDRSIIGHIHDHFHRTTPSNGLQNPKKKVEPLPSDYQQRTAQVKQDLLWKRIQQTAFTEDNMNTVPHPDKKNLTNINFLIHSFTHVGDEVPEGRLKLSHQFGAVGKVELEIFQNSPYSGILHSGAPTALLRLSVAKYDDPTYMATGFAMKILLDGHSSVNMHSFFSSEGQELPDNNFFRKTVTQVVPEPFTPLLLHLGKFFNETLTLLPPAPDRPENNKVLGFTEFASIKTNGQKIPTEEIVVPYKIDWIPNPWLTERFENKTGTDFRLQLLDIPQGTVLYDVVAHRQRDSDGVFIGRVVSRSPFVASQYGDEVLFFQHANKRWIA